MKSFIRTTSPKKIIKEYNLSFRNIAEHKKIMWHSKKSMINRFKLLFKLIKNLEIDSWIDFGTGTGKIFEIYKKSKKNIKKIYGIEINKLLINLAKRKKFPKSIILKNSDIIKFKSKEKFDLVTLIGVLQNCGYNPLYLLKRCFKILNKKGYIFLTTKNLLWKKFSKENKPDKSHSWFYPSDLINFFERNSVEIIKISGFNPHKNKITNLNNSNTLFILGRKK